jgi:hypothetical protein
LETLNTLDSGSSEAMSLWLLVVIPLLVGLAVNEIYAWLPATARSVVGAARCLPADERPLYFEEWTAEIAACGERGLFALLWSLSLLPGAFQLRREFQAVARTAEAARGSSAPVETDADFWFAVWRAFVRNLVASTSVDLVVLVDVAAEHSNWGSLVRVAVVTVGVALLAVATILRAATIRRSVR